MYSRKNTMRIKSGIHGGILLTLLFFSPSAHALELALSGGIRSFSTQAENGSQQYHPTVGARLGFLTKSRVSPEINVTHTRANFSGIKVQENSYLFGIRFRGVGSEKSSSVGFLFGVGHLETKYASGVNANHSVSGLYGGLAFNFRLGLFTTRLDIIKVQHFNRKDSSFIMNLSLGVNL